MANSYFLINDELRFYFNLQPRSLHYHQNEVRLPPKEAQTLQYALDNRDRIIKPDEIAVHLWGEEAVNADYTNKKSQAITHVSKIRRRLEQLEYPKDILKTQENQGYKVTCSVEYVSSEVLRQQVIEKKISKEKRMHRLTKLKYSFISVFVTVLCFVGLYLMVSRASISVDNITQLAPLYGVSVEPRFSPDGKAIAFSYESKSKVAKIYLKVDSDINYRALTNNHFDQSPNFSPSGSQLAFHRSSPDSCEIRLLTLDSDYNLLGGDHKIADCHKFTDLSSITWLSETVLLFTDRLSATGPMHIYQLDLTSGKTSQYLAITDEDYFGTGYFYITFDHANQWLIALEAENWTYTNIYRIGEDKHRHLLKTVKDILSSIAILNQLIIFKDLDNQFKSFRVDDSTEIETIYSNMLNPITYPNISARQSKIAFVSGEYHQTTIHRYSIATGQSAEVISAGSKLKLPKASKHELLVVSKESGINQIYVYANNSRYQLSSFNTNLKIIDFATSADQKWLAVNFPQGTTLYKRNLRGLVVVKEFPLMTFPGFSPTSQRLLLSDHNQLVNVQSKLVEYDLSGYDRNGQISATGVVVNNARFGVYHGVGIIYTPDDGPGIYFFTVGGNTLVNADIEPFSPAGFALTETHLFLGTVAQSQFLKVDLATGESKVLPSYLYGSFSIAQNSIFYTTHTMGRMNIVVGDIVRNKISLTTP